MPKTIIFDCPFCDSKKVIVVNASFCGVKAFNVYCKSCLAHGPNATSPEKAISKWGITSSTGRRAHAFTTG